ncbi:MAG: peptide chain release factor 2 [Candidatus Methylomirabilales bacterium]
MDPELKRKLEELERKLEGLRGYLDLEGKKQRLKELEGLVQTQDLWTNAERAQKLLKERGQLQELVDSYEALRNSLEEQKLYFELAKEGEDLTALRELWEAVRRVERRIRDLELRTVLSGEYDRGNAILTINPGAGGVESQDWAQMLLRIYLRWAERKGYKAEILDILPGEEAGIKNATVSMSGPYAYGYLKVESGVHRLVRISPFDASRRRHTSFASVFVYPEVEEVKVEIDEKDLKVETFRASGHGGQHVNVTDSAVRITHLPTGIVVSCQNERSQHKNRAIAMKVLRARLYEYYLRQQEKELKKLEKGKKEIAWGSQIRSYILAPYQLVKDHRTGLETGDTKAVLDGEIDPFIEACLFQGKASP